MHEPLVSAMHSMCANTNQQLHNIRVRLQSRAYKMLANSASPKYIETGSYSIGISWQIRWLRCCAGTGEANCNRKLDYRCCLRTIFLHSVPLSLSLCSIHVLCLQLCIPFRFFHSLPLRRCRQSELENKFVYNIQICLDNIAPGHDIMENELLCAISLNAKHQNLVISSRST